MHTENNELSVAMLALVKTANSMDVAGDACGNVACGRTTCGRPGERGSVISGAMMASFSLAAAGYADTLS